MAPGNGAWDESEWHLGMAPGRLGHSGLDFRRSVRNLLRKADHKDETGESISMKRAPGMTGDSDVDDSIRIGEGYVKGGTTPRKTRSMQIYAFI